MEVLVESAHRRLGGSPRAAAVDEGGFRFVAGQAHAAARDYYLYAALDELEKLGIAVLAWDEVVGTQEITGDDALTRVVLERSLDEQSFWQRKAIELLVDLVCFSTTNETPYYRHLLLLRELQGRLSIQQDLKTFYGAPSANVAWSIDRTLAEIRDLEASEIDLSRAWYAQHRQPLTEAPDRPERILTTVRRRLQTALERMDPHEKMAAGLSYARGYGTASEDVHFRPQATLREINSDAVARGIDRVAVVGMAALRRVQALLDRVPAGMNETIRDAFEHNDYPAQVLKKRTRDRAEVGDFVLEGRYLCEVLEKRESAFGYHIYRVRYLAERPVPEIEEDWLLAEGVRRFHTRAQFLQLLCASIERGDAPPDALERFESRQPEEQQDVLRGALLNTWEHGGLRELVREERRRSQ